MKIRAKIRARKNLFENKQKNKKYIQKKTEIIYLKKKSEMKKSKKNVRNNLFENKQKNKKYVKKRRNLSEKKKKCYKKNSEEKKKVVEP